ncbi:MAG: DUF86 domain-containing protein [Armatimonadetes bacterium]|nr:DUF86 domain-containing protein [Armatimonadota bacterium]
MREDTQRLYDILEAIERIERYAGIDRKEFETNELIQTWMVHNLQVIGEAASQLSQDFRKNHTDIPWRAISSMRNAIVHAYFRVDLDEVWTAVCEDVPQLKTGIHKVLDTDR